MTIDVHPKRVGIGHNEPPDMTATASDTMQALSDWMKDHPVVLNESDAREAKVFIDRGKLCIKDIEDERDKKVRPLNEQVKAINEHYRPSRDQLRRVLDELQSRITAWLRQEEEKRIAAAEEARRKAAEAEAHARAAEEAERQKLANAASGELDIDIAEATREADQKFEELKKANRQAGIAERDARVKIGGGFGRSLSLKTAETLIVVDAIIAINAIGITSELKEVILKGARSFRRLYGVLPDGVISETERKV